MTRQTFIPGTEPPGRNEEIERRIELWYEAKAAQKEAAEVTAIRQASVVEAAIEAERDVYPFLEPETGRRKVLDVTAVRRARVKRAVSEKQEAADKEFDAGSRAPSGVTMTVNGGAPVTAAVVLEKLIEADENITARRAGADRKARAARKGTR